MTAMPEASRADPIIRDATAEDIPHVADIYAVYVRTGLASFEETPPDVHELRSRHSTVRSAGLPYLVAEVGGEITGYAYAGTYRGRSGYRFTVEDSVYVAQAWHGRGIGRALLESLIERCERGPWRQMLAVIGDSANAGSIALHRRCGFAQAGAFHSVGYKLGRWVDVVLMQRALGAGDASAPG